ncbi:calcium load-activated calcium channel isoform X2 [Enhydra lutris kenyoni]|uniref:Calcium load-activated calcium channel n=1 Tax=Enhydra lutris kenyoni TaxID=391180 RepID=A0A2Y9JUI0_ENHLU|nr:calcium load-activated calcium channel isoform X2 [Enhydra lutris kenyoni]
MSSSRSVLFGNCRPPCKPALLSASLLLLSCACPHLLVLTPVYSNERQEEKLKNNNRDLSMVRMKSMFAIGFCFTALMGMFNSIFDGRVVAKLPFTPLSYIQGLSHRNLLGDDTTDCSFIFLYILCTMSIRQNIQKILGLAPSRAATKQAGGFLGPPPPSGKFS